MAATKQPQEPAPAAAADVAKQVNGHDPDLARRRYRKRKPPLVIELEDERGAVEEYEIHSIDLDAWNMAVQRRAKLDSQGRVVKVDTRGQQVDLISRALRKNGKPVPAEVIEGWDTACKLQLHRDVLEYNGMSEEQVRQEGKD